VVRGAKGGVGGSVVATNLAVAIQRQTGQRVALVDAHPFGGDIALALNPGAGAYLGRSDPAREFAGRRHARVDDDAARERGRRAPAPFDPEQGDMISAEHFYKVLEGVRARHDYVIVDSGPTVDPNSINRPGHGRLLLLVSTPELARAQERRGQFRPARREARLPRGQDAPGSQSPE
jgi:pilus assembly protein CpaE